ncbi:MAG TPA: YbhB/YbcL family Raf kinase inhibitor-like protein [Steroidobacteraceae bacterium]|nr:YbhB/YbcL family Raf kinase inhibitor-like protein [Steroidobacteraceae bacterium]
MHENRTGTWVRATLTVAVVVAGMSLSTVGADEPRGDRRDHRMELTSTTFADHGTLPVSAVDNIVQNGINICTANGAAGGDESPQLAWSHVPHDTRSFVVVLYDPTAAFTHWGMYNIPADTRMLPQNAGVANSTFGTEVFNDFFDPSYDGPCPPAGVAPVVHEYRFTVYALDTELTLPSSANFPANSETLYHALIDAARDGHILASASIVGRFSATP